VINDIPFTIRLREDMYIEIKQGQQSQLRSLLGKKRHLACCMLANFVGTGMAGSD